MATVSVNANSIASSADPFVHISVRPDAGASYQLRIFSPSIFRTITGTLPGGRWLTHPLGVKVEYDNEEVVVSEPRFHIHASAASEAEALAAFRRIFSGYLDVLASREDKLDSYLREQLAYLRSYITAE